MSQDHPEWVQLIHKLNDVLHAEPYASIAEGFFWYLVLLVTCPLAAFASIFYSLYKVIYVLFLKKEILPKDLPDQELAVVVTGCDSGFGQELVFSLVSKGFVVFAACLKKESFDQFQSEPKIYPLQVNVTSDDDVENAAKQVSKWIEEEPTKRHLHALVNNAGTGIGGLADWMKLSDFQFIHDVNFFGTLRMCKACLPILKRQVSEGSYTNSRIVNMVSTAGLFAGGIVSNAYECSKHAVDAFTTNLRIELQPLGIKVCAVNPGTHNTPLATGKNIAAGMKKVWDAMAPEHRAEYGEDYFNAVSGIFEKSTGKFSWDKKYVVEAMDEAVVWKDPPARILVGMDAKFGLYPLSKLPTVFRLNFIRKRPAMLDKKEKAA